MSEEKGESAQEGEKAPIQYHVYYDGVVYDDISPDVTAAELEEIMKKRKEAPSASQKPKDSPSAPQKPKDSSDSNCIGTQCEIEKEKGHSSDDSFETTLQVKDSYELAKIRPDTFKSQKDSTCRCTAPSSLPESAPQPAPQQAPQPAPQQGTQEEQQADQQTKHQPD